jgi:general secretion pathway protein D
MRFRGTAILLALVAAVAATSCADFRRLVERPSKPDAASPTPLSIPASQESGSQAADAAPADPEPQVEKKVVKGSGNFINRAAASLPPVEVTDEGDVILNFAGADIQDVVRSILGTMLKRNYVLHPKVQGKVTVQTSRPLPRSALLATLESVLRIHGAAIVRNAGVYKILPINEAPNSVVRPSVALPRGVRDQGFGVQIVPLRFISAQEMERVLQPVSPAGSVLRVDVARNLLLLAGTRQERVNMLDVVSIFDVDWLAGMSIALVPLQAAAPKAILEDLQQVFGNAEGGPLAGVVRFQPIERLNSILVITSRPEYLDKAQSWIERLDGGVEGGERSLHVYLVQNGRSADLADVLNQIFGDKGADPGARRSDSAAEGGDAAGTRANGTRRGGTTATQSAQRDAQNAGTQRNAQTAGQGRAGENQTAAQRRAAAARAGSGVALPAGEGMRIIADEKNNALVILATPREYRSILAAIEKLDIRPLQVLIEATIAEVSLTDELRYGLQWFFKSGASEFTLSSGTSSAIAPTFPGFSYLLGLSDIRVVLDALDKVTDFKVISSPQLMVLDNETAILQVGDEVPVQTGTTTNDQGTTTSTQFRDTGVILEVTPRVNAGGLVQLDVSQEASQAIVKEGEPNPTIQQRKIESTIAIQSGQTVALGGLIREERTASSSGIPILSRIPILGALFGSTADTGLRTELLILITPRVIRNQREAEVVTDELRKRVRALTPLDERIR